MKRLRGHPGIVHVDRTFTFHGRTALVMPYAGHSLKWFIAQNTVRPAHIDQILAWIATLLECLSFAHGKQIIHLDIKPSNILIDEFGDIRLVDFGLAQKIQYVEFQHSTIVRGTLCYMAPEQQLAHPATRQTDIYSLGAVLYELVTGEKPVGRFRNAGHYNRDLPVRVEHVINKCLERDLELRYKSADEVLSDLTLAREHKSETVTDTGIVTESPAMARVIDAARISARLPAPVLITGETGVGKELVARLIYSEYKQRTPVDVPFVPLNCAALTGFLAESEFFGHRKGAFTGALQDRIGAFQLADRGVLFLDEIGELPYEVQGKLLRVLDSGTFAPMGAASPVKVNVRVVCATNRNLAAEVEAGRFRQDLFARLNGFIIPVPPLRARLSDIPALIRHFSVKHGGFRRFSSAAMKVMKSYSWPGNVRELENAVATVQVLVEEDGEVLPEHLSLHILEFQSMGRETRLTVSLRDARSTAERSAIESALDRSGGAIHGAAPLLGISEGYLRKLRRKYEI